MSNEELIINAVSAKSNASAAANLPSVLASTLRSVDRVLDEPEHASTGVRAETNVGSPVLTPQKERAKAEHGHASSKTRAEPNVVWLSGVRPIAEVAADPPDVLFDKTLDVKTDIVTRLGLLGTLVVHLDGEDLVNAKVETDMYEQEDDKLHNVLLNMSGQSITDTLDRVDAGVRHVHQIADWAFKDTVDLVK